MNINSMSNGTNLIQSSKEMGDMLKQITQKEMGFEEKMMKQSIISELTGVGKNLDITG